MNDYRRTLEARIPAYTMDAIRRWIDHGHRPGDFLFAVLRNDLYRAVRFADESNRAAICEIVTWLYHYAPGECWGSQERIEAWPEEIRGAA